MVLALVLQVAFAGWWFSSLGEEPGAQNAPIDTAGRAIGSVPATAGDIDVAADLAARTVAAGESLPAQPPIPPDARWIEVTIVDAATQEPVPQAEVAYINHTVDDSGDETLSHAELVRCSEDDEARVRRFGWRTRADARGMARVHLGRGTTIFARDGERIGSKELETDDPAPPGGHRVELRPDRTLRVRVVDAAGAPVIGAQVILETFDAADESDGDHHDTRETLAPDGIAVVAHTQDLRRQQHDAHDGEASGWRVRLEMAGVALPAVKFDPQAPPADPVTLSMPGHGRIRVGTSVFGQPVTSHEPQLNWSRLDGRHTISETGTHDGAGFVLFAPVALHRTYVATACNGAIRREFAGPKAPGELVEVVLDPSADDVFVRGGVLAADEQPITDTYVRYTLSGAGRGGDHALRTDGAGRFLLWLGAPAAAEQVDLRLTWHTEHGPTTATPGPLPMTSGVHDVGNLLLRPLPLVVSGTCVENGTDGARGGTLVVQRWQTGAWQRCEDLLERYEGGRFTAHGTVAPGRLRLGCFRDGARSPWIEFEAGATALVVPMTSDGVLAANVQLPASGDGAVRAIVLREPGADGPRDAAARPWADDQLESADGERVVRRWHVPQPGTYTLEFRLWSDEPLLRIAGIEMPAPPGGDPRLAAIDLRELVEQVTLEPRDATGARLAEAEIIKVLPFGRAPTAEWPVFRGYGFAATTLVPRGGADVWIAVDGFRPQVVRGARGHVAVHLRPWPEVELRIEVPALPAGATVFARLVEAEPKAGEPGELATCPDWSFAVVDGCARLPIGEGSYRVVVTIGCDNVGEIVPVDGPASVHASPVPVAIRIQQASWQQALTSLAAKRGGDQRR